MSRSKRILELARINKVEENGSDNSEINLLATDILPSTEYSTVFSDEHTKVDDPQNDLTVVHMEILDNLQMEVVENVQMEILDVPFNSVTDDNGCNLEYPSTSDSTTQDEVLVSPFSISQKINKSKSSANETMECKGISIENLLIPENVNVNKTWKIIQEPKDVSTASDKGKITSISDSSSQSDDPISDESTVGLVPYSEHSDSDMSLDYPQKSVKRKKRFQVDKSTWFSNKNKILREQGKQYCGRIKNDNKWYYNEPKQPRKMKGRCKCKTVPNGILKCSSVTEAERKVIFNQFWKFTWGEKKVYIDNLVKSIPTKRHRQRKKPTESRRKQSLEYHLKINNDQIRVCRAMFLNTLGIGRWSVLFWKNSFATRQASNTRVSTEHRIQPFNDARAKLFEFLDTLPVLESHYCRAHTEKKYLLPEWHSKKNVYDFYVSDWCSVHNLTPLSITVFSEALSEKNIALFSPKKDQCEKCTIYKLGQLSEDDYNLHIKRKNEARTEKECDKQEQSFVFTADLQGVLLAPKSNVSSLYYRTKLQVHNLCFFDLNSKNGYCYLWNEAEGGVNSEEFASIWIHFLENKVLPQVNNMQSNKENSEKVIIIYTDGCTYQNRNSVMSNALLNFVMNFKITIIQKYLEVGHTQMEADAMHSTIERRLKNTNINVPAEYVHICRTARKKPTPYDVAYLSYSFFKSFDSIAFFKSIRPGRNKGDAKVTDIRALKYTPDGNIFYKLTFGDNWQLLPQRKCPNAVPRPFHDLNSLYKERLKIKARKFLDLQYLKQTIPADYHDFYDNIPHE